MKSKKNVRKRKRTTKRHKKDFDVALFLKSFFFTMLLISFMFLLAVVDYKSRGIAGYVDASAFSFSIDGENIDIALYSKEFAFGIPEFIKKIIEFIASLF